MEPLCIRAGKKAFSSPCGLQPFPAALRPEALQQPSAKHGRWMPTNQECRFGARRHSSNNLTSHLSHCHTARHVSSMTGSHVTARVQTTITSIPNMIPLRDCFRISHCTTLPAYRARHAMLPKHDFAVGLSFRLIPVRCA